METQSEVLGDGPRFVNDAPPFVSMSAPGKWVNKLGLPFSAGKDWSPANYLTFLKEKGLLRGDFITIYWTAPGQWHIRPI
jgi:hypothetical protein